MSHPTKHTPFEDIFALLCGTFLIAQGIFFLQHAELLCGGTTGLALLATKFTSISFGVLYFLFNIPFYIMGWFRFGKQFTIRSIIASLTVSIITDNLNQVFNIAWLSPLYCAFVAGVLLGLGMLIIFRHNASLGGFNVLALYCQDKFNLPAGKVQMAIDCSILFASFFFASPFILLCSVIGAIVMNLILAINHRADRYLVCH